MSETVTVENNVVFHVATAGIIDDGIIWCRISFEDGGEFAVRVEPHTSQYPYWLWLLANRERFPELNRAELLAALQSVTAEEIEKVKRDHGLPDSRT